MATAGKETKVESDVKALGHTAIPVKVRVKNLAAHYTLSLGARISLDTGAELANWWFAGGHRRQGCHQHGMVTVGGVLDGVARQVSLEMALAVDVLVIITLVVISSRCACYHKPRGDILASILTILHSKPK
jgi:hypothetical protein